MDLSKRGVQQLGKSASVRLILVNVLLPRHSLRHVSQIPDCGHRATVLLPIAGSIILDVALLLALPTSLNYVTVYAQAPS